MVTRANLSEARWHRSVQYRHACSECGEVHLVAVISYHGDRIRLCRECFLDGFWRDRQILERVAEVLP